MCFQESGHGCGDASALRKDEMLSEESASEPEAHLFRPSMLTAVFEGEYDGWNHPEVIWSPVKKPAMKVRETIFTKGN